jgi:hypothetical protein
VLPLPVGSFGPTVFNLSVPLLEAIMVGQAYINIHTVQHGAGEWGHARSLGCDMSSSR